VKALKRFDLQVKSEFELKMREKFKRRLNNAGDRRSLYKKKQRLLKKHVKPNLNLRRVRRSKRNQVKPSSKKDWSKDNYMNPAGSIDLYDYLDSSFEDPIDNCEESIQLKPKFPRECKSN